jgi:polyphosphate glucokinase
VAFTEASRYTERVRITGGTLAIDIGGTGLKAAVIDPEGKMVNERVRVETPRPATPQAVLDALGRLIAAQPSYERISVGFPGVVVDGVVLTAPNLDGQWRGVRLAAELERLSSRPVRAANDADVQGLGVIEGRGVELVLTLGTGIGSGLYLDGKLFPNLELGHHPFRKGDTYEEQLGLRAYQEIGKEKWNRRLRRAIDVLGPIFNYRALYLGGGNAKKIKGALPANVKIVDNVAGILGGVRLWA